MAHHNLRQTERTLFLRRSRVRELSRHAPLVLALLLVPTLAGAEVCDKAVGESWRPADGPVWLLNPVGLPIAVTILVSGLVLVAVARLRWFGYLGSAFLVLNAAVLVFADLVPEHDIYLAQIREGCRSYRTDLMDVGLMTIFAVAYGWLGHRAKRQPANA